MCFKILILLLTPFLLNAEESLKWSKAQKVHDTFINSHKMELTFIPAGSFMMGSPDNEATRTNGEKLHKVNLTQSFLMGTTEVTQEQFKTVMGIDMKELLRRRTDEAAKANEEKKSKLAKMSKEEKANYLKEFKALVNDKKYPDGPRQNPKRTLTKEQKAELKITQSEIKALKEQYKKEKKAGTHIVFKSDHPIGFVAWSEAVKFCKKLTKLEHEKGTLPKNWSYRLPTEAEWEYSCRAGTSTPVFTGKQPDPIDRESIQNFKKYAWGNTNAGDKTHPVKNLKPNPWGLYDIYGNVSEWCLDIYAPYTSEEVVDPLVLEGKYMMRISRGLNSHCTMNGFRSATRKTGGPRMPYYSFFGFRVVCAPMKDLTENIPHNHTNK